MWRNLLLAWCCLFVAAAPATRADLSSKIPAVLLEKTADGRTAEFIVLMKEQADVSAAYRFPTKSERTRYVFERLTATARRTQKDIRTWLDRHHVPYRPFYIVNALWVRGDRSTLTALARRPDVWKIEDNPEIPLQPPTPMRPAAGPRTIEWNIARTKAPQVWNMGYTGQGIVIGIGDTGVEWTHPALIGHYRGWDGSNANHDYNWHDAIHPPASGGSCGPDVTEPCDDYGHGTHVTGTATGDDGGSNQIGMAPGAKWIACRNMNVGNGTPARYIECFEFFLAPYPVGGDPSQGDPTKAADVTSNSWGCPPSEGCAWDSLKIAVQNQRAAGIMTVVAAGNSGPACGTVTDPPAIYDAAYTVGSTNSSNGMSGFSSRGPAVTNQDDPNLIKPDIVAPGSGVRSSVPGGGYATWSGTSMATPHISGAVALLWSAIPSLKNQIDATEIILNHSAVKLTSIVESCGGDYNEGPNNTWGNGLIDIFNAVNQDQDIQVTPTNLDFGDVNPGNMAFLPVEVMNVGSHDLVIGIVTSPPSPFGILFNNCSTVTLLPGTSCSIVYKFQPGIPGTYSGTSDIPSNDPDEPVVQVSLTGRGIGMWLTGTALTVADGTGNNNGILEPGESAVLEMTWNNSGTLDALGVTGTLTTTDPMTLTDAQATYGDILQGSTVSCADNNDCYAVQASTARPGDHWDVTLTESLSSGQNRDWIVHIGESFTDVPISHLFYSYVETLLHSGITAGCQTGKYCPAGSVTRAQMAIFLARAMTGGDNNVPQTGSVGTCAYDCSSGGTSCFADVAPTASYCRHVHYLASQGVTSGCNATDYCPGAPITRAQMGVFLARIMAGGDGAVPPSGTTGSCNYDCTTGGVSCFTDVPATASYCRHVHYIAAQGVTSGCTATRYCPNDPNTRGQMAVFLVRAFQLVLYGP